LSNKLKDFSIFLSNLIYPKRSSLFPSKLTNKTLHLHTNESKIEFHIVFMVMCHMRWSPFQILLNDSYKFNNFLTNINKKIE